ncbi:MAG: YraN family protein [Candidatus Chromulinivorax sp.]
MQSDTKKLGNQGELFVVQYLQQHGFTLHCQNYRQFFGEIDVIAYKKSLYLFVEVKTRKTHSSLMGQLISKSKQEKIIKTAQYFIAEQKLSNITARFDVALLIQEQNNFHIDYIENAFTQQDQGYYGY